MSVIESEIESPKPPETLRLLGGSPRLWMALGILTLLAAILCITGIGFGLPHDSRPDEIPNIQVALTVLKDIVGQGPNALNPKSFNYGSLYYYILTACYWLYFSLGQLFPGINQVTQWADFNGLVFTYQVDPTPFHLIIRYVSAVAAILLTPVIFFTAKQWQLPNNKDQKTSAPNFLPWIATSLMALNYLVIRNAHFGSPDTLMTLGILVSLMMLWRFQQNTGDDKRLQWAGIAIGLASSIKIPAVLMLIPLAWACLSPHSNRNSDTIEWKAAGTKFVRGLGWALLAFALTSPWMILDIPGVLHWFSYEGAFYGFTMPGMPVGWEFYPTFTLPIGLGFLTYLMSFVGFTLIIHETRNSETSTLKRSQNITLLLGLFVFTLFLGPNLRIMTRYALPLIPFLLLLSSHACQWLLQKTNTRIPQQYQNNPRHAFILFLAMAGILCAEPLAYSIQWDSLLLQGDTRQMAADWIKRNIPEKTAIATGPRLGQIRLPLSYGQLMLETGPNNMSPPERPSMEEVSPQSKLINSYDVSIMKQLGIRYVILYGGNLLFSSPSWEIERYFNDYHLTPILHISPLKPNTQNLISRTPTAVYDPLDALFIPYVGFTDSAFTGPDIFIFDLNQLETAGLKNPGNPK